MSNRHNLSDINLNNLTATCAVCGPDTPIRFQNRFRPNGQPICNCRNKIKQTDKDRYSSKKRAQTLRAKWSRRLNMTDEDFNRYIHETNCDICGEHRGNKYLVLDHCHASNQFRGVLCGQCNSGLGMFRDSPDTLAKAIEYLESFNAKKPLPISE